MASRSVQLLCIAVACAAVAEARSLKPVSLVAKASQTPAQAGRYVDDKQPKVDVLHFQHPYPLVQDKDKFDKDFIKDENSDNGQYAAQSNYDRLRHVLTKQKQEVADALAKKNKEQKDLDQQNKLHDMDKAESEKHIATLQAEVDKLIAEDKAADLKAADMMAQHKVTMDKSQENLQSIKDPKPLQKKEPEPEPEPTKAPVAEKKAEAAPEAPKAAVIASTEGAKNGVLDAKKEVARCQKELDEATAELKTLMDGLAKVKVAHADATAAWTTADKHETSVEKEEVTLHKKFDTESKEFKAAEKAYAFQKERVEKLKKDLKAAAKLVKGHRDDEDADGGVSNSLAKMDETENLVENSAASLLAASPLLAIFAAVAAW